MPLAVSLDPRAARCVEVGKRQLRGSEAAALAKEPNRARVMHDRVELLGHLSDVGIRPSSDVSGGWWSGTGIHEPEALSLARRLVDARPAVLSKRLGFEAPGHANRVSRQPRSSGATSSLAGAAMGQAQSGRSARRSGPRSSWTVPLR